ncbi:MAG: hypothetical protein AAGC56_13615, partial [Pseudomonadota bacterium]
MIRSVHLILTGLALIAGARTAAADDADIRALADAYGALPAIRSADVSPDGSLVAFKYASKGRYALLIRNLADPSRPARLWRPAAGTDLSTFYWTSGNQIIVVTEKLAVKTTASMDPKRIKSGKRVYSFFKQQLPKLLSSNGKKIADLSLDRLGMIENWRPLQNPELTAGTVTVFVDSHRRDAGGSAFSAATLNLKTGRYDLLKKPASLPGYYDYKSSV